MEADRAAFQGEKGRLMAGSKNLSVLATTSITLIFGATLAAQTPATLAAQTPPKPSLPYTAVHDPQFIPAPAAEFLHDPDRIIGLMAGNVAKAYPAAILSQHGLVEDQSPSGPIAVTW